MKKIWVSNVPLSLLPGVIFIALVVIFIALPSGADLISEKGDYIAGAVLGVLFIVTFMYDIVQYKKNKTKAPENEANKELELQEKRKKIIANAGNLTCGMGWLAVVVNFSFLLWSRIDLSYPTAVPRPDISSVVIVFAIAFIYIVLGNRVRRLNDVYTKRYLWILLIATIVFDFFIMRGGGRVTTLSILVLMFILQALSTWSQVIKSDVFKATLVHQKYLINKKGWVFFVVATLLLLAIAVWIDITYPYIPKNMTIPELVTWSKRGVNLPMQIDNYITFTDIRANNNAIRYEYLISNVNENDISLENMQSVLHEQTCGDHLTRSILRRGINVEYTYLLKDTKKTFTLPFTDSDCAQ